MHAKRGMAKAAWQKRHGKSGMAKELHGKSGLAKAAWPNRYGKSKRHDGQIGLAKNGLASNSGMATEA